MEVIDEVRSEERGSDGNVNAVRRSESRDRFIHRRDNTGSSGHYPFSVSPTSSRGASNSYTSTYTHTRHEFQGVHGVTR